MMDSELKAYVEQIIASEKAILAKTNGAAAAYSRGVIDAMTAVLSRL